MTDETSQAGVPDEFEQIGARADEIDGAGAQLVEKKAADEQAAQQDEAAGMVEDLVSVLKMARGMASAAFAWWPEFGGVWNDDVLKGIAYNGAMIMIRHGLTAAELMTRWGPYLGLLAVTAPSAMATYQAVKLRKLQQEGGAHGGDQQAGH